MCLMTATVWTARMAKTAKAAFLNAVDSPARRRYPARRYWIIWYQILDQPGWRSGLIGRLAARIQIRPGRLPSSKHSRPWFREGHVDVVVLGAQVHDVAGCFGDSQAQREG